MAQKLEQPAIVSMSAAARTLGWTPEQMQAAVAADEPLPTVVLGGNRYVLGATLDEILAERAKDAEKHTMNNFIRTQAALRRTSQSATPGAGMNDFIRKATGRNKKSDE